MDYRMHATIPREKKTSLETGMDHIQYGIGMIVGIAEGRMMSKADREIRLSLAYKNAQKANEMGADPWNLLQKLKPYEEEIENLMGEKSIDLLKELK